MSHERRTSYPYLSTFVCLFYTGENEGEGIKTLLIIIEEGKLEVPSLYLNCFYFMYFIIKYINISLFSNKKVHKNGLQTKEMKK